MSSIPASPPGQGTTDSAPSAAELRRWLIAYHETAGAPAEATVAVLDGLLAGVLDAREPLRELRELLSILAALEADPRTLCSAMLFVAHRHGEPLEPWRERLPPGVAAQLDSLLELRRVQAENLDPSRERSDEAVRRAGAKVGLGAEGLRRLLLALVSDVRVVLIELAWQLVQLRAARDQPEAAAALAEETMLIHAPLANRLGIWQLKWELEDLAFRYSEPEQYRRIARQVAERREDRENFIRGFTGELERLLREAGVSGEVLGRPKHIYSIWRKMQRKHLDFQELFDIRAVRVLVEDVPACYSVLGLVHTRWQPIPGEFDDYITTPKGNNYQSLHTAVVGPGGKAVEVQIRTREMNEHAELGVAAHWRYKEGGPNDPAFDRKITAMRQLLETGDEGLDDEALLESFRSATSEDRVYVLTPKGQVVDLALGATVLDFAYHVHTEVGHRCRGAKVNGRIVPLTHVVANGDRVEILTAREPRPSRDWLNPRLGFVHGARARAKVRQWFRKEGYEESLAQGRELVEAELRRMGLQPADLDGVPERFQLKGREDLFAAVGNGDLTVAQVVSAAERLHQEQRETTTSAEDLVTRAPRRARQRQAAESGGITIEGVGNLMTTIARCCQPVPGDPVVGYVTRGRGVTVHREDCANVLRWQNEEPHRLLEVGWGRAPDSRYRAGIWIQAYNRRELFKDISAVMAAADVTVTDISSRQQEGSELADIRLQVQVRDYEQLSELLSRILAVRNVVEARRLREPAP
jgi:GTP pyrophosphokinase